MSTKSLQAPNSDSEGGTMSYGSVLPRKCPSDDSPFENLSESAFSVVSRKCPFPFLQPTFDEHGEVLTDLESLGESYYEMYDSEKFDYLKRIGPHQSIDSPSPSIESILPHLSELEHINYTDMKNRIRDCGTEMKAYIHCNCSAIPILNNCGSNVCDSCWNSKCLKQRDTWEKKLQFDRGRSYRFLTLTSPRRYFVWELDQAMTNLHTSFRKLTKSSWWRGLSRLWFGTIEFEPAWSEYPDEHGVMKIVPTVNLHIHVVVGGKMLPINKLREKWMAHGGGNQVHIKYLKKGETRASTLKGIVEYLAKYITNQKGSIQKDRNGNIRHKLSWDEIPEYYQAIASLQLKTRQMFISGGAMRTRLAQLLKANPDTPVIQCCISCFSVIGFTPITDNSEPPSILRTQPPSKGQWVKLCDFTSLHSTPPDPVTPITYPLPKPKVSLSDSDPHQAILFADMMIDNNKQTVFLTPDLITEIASKGGF